MSTKLTQYNKSANNISIKWTSPFHTSSILTQTNVNIRNKLGFWLLL